MHRGHKAIIIIISSSSSSSSSSVVGRDGAVGIATRYGLDSPGIESQWGQDFSAPNQTGPGAHPASYTMGIGSLSCLKADEAWHDHPPHLASRLKKE